MGRGRQAAKRPALCDGAFQHLRLELAQPSTSTLAGSVRCGAGEGMYAVLWSKKLELDRGCAGMREMLD